MEFSHAMIKYKESSDAILNKIRGSENPCFTAALFGITLITVSTQEGLMDLPTAHDWSQRIFPLNRYSEALQARARDRLANMEENELHALLYECLDMFHEGNRWFSQMSPHERAHISEYYKALEMSWMGECSHEVKA